MKLVEISAVDIPGHGKCRQYVIEATEGETPRDLAIEFCQAFATIPVRLMATVPQIAGNNVIINLFNRRQTIGVLEEYGKLKALCIVLAAIED